MQMWDPQRPTRMMKSPTATAPTAATVSTPPAPVDSSVSGMGTGMGYEDGDGLWGVGMKCGNGGSGFIHEWDESWGGLWGWGVGMGTVASSMNGLWGWGWVIWGVGMGCRDGDGDSGLICEWDRDRDGVWGWGVRIRE